MGCAIGQARPLSAPGRFKRVVVGWKSCHKGTARVRLTPLPRLGARTKNHSARGWLLVERQSSGGPDREGGRMPASARTAWAV
jgi:hypothetical protein